MNLFILSPVMGETVVITSLYLSSVARSQTAPTALSAGAKTGLAAAFSVFSPNINIFNLSSSMLFKYCSPVIRAICIILSVSVIKSIHNI